MKRIFNYKEKDEIMLEIEQVQNEIRAIKKQECRSIEEQNRLDVLTARLHRLKSL